MSRLKLPAFLLLLPVITLGVYDQGLVKFTVGPGAGVINGLTGQPMPPGNSFSAGLYYAPDGISDEALFVQVGAPAGFGPDGRYAGGIRTVPTPTPGGYAMLQIRAWESAYGITYEQALAAPPMNGPTNSSFSIQNFANSGSCHSLQRFLFTAQIVSSYRQLLSASLHTWSYNAGLQRFSADISDLRTHPARFWLVRICPFGHQSVILFCRSREPAASFI